MTAAPYDAASPWVAAFTFAAFAGFAAWLLIVSFCAWDERRRLTRWQRGMRRLAKVVRGAR